METFSVFITHCTTILWEKNSNANEGSVFLVACCGIISGSSAKCCLQAPHSFESLCFPPKYFYYKFKTVPRRHFVALKELVEEFILENVSYLWTNENTFFMFFLSKPGELFP